MKPHDFVALERAVWAATAHDAGATVAPEAQWCTDYPSAIERALIVHDFARLLSLLEAGEPLHPTLLPALADALRARGNKPPGRKRALVSTEVRFVAESVLSLRWKGLSDAAAIAQVAREVGCSESVVKRALASVPKHRRPARISSKSKAIAGS